MTSWLCRLFYKCPIDKRRAGSISNLGIPFTVDSAIHVRRTKQKVDKTTTNFAKVESRSYTFHQLLTTIGIYFTEKYVLTEFVYDRITHSYSEYVNEKDYYSA